ncbi:probable enoyl-CoA hydratase 1, peroxisomal [Diospyros lotus]|uniref:probable enoyl-CoA hydratase 1, peroxisomal n=1 Tax=Diospyros lotus TaxID=55363 RepID=UPI0022549EE1|nr:probable enoyl-CoA hydratase 1, peroxisomal [Diospyros lotus]
MATAPLSVFIWGALMGGGEREGEPDAMDRAAPEELILLTREPDGIAHVTINRPKLLNSLTRPMIADLARAFKSLDADDSVRVVILSGSGRAFCAGVDLTSAEDVFKGDVKDPDSDAVLQMERCRKPIIGAIAGFAVTAGFEIALACDVVVAAKGAKFIDTHARFGIFPSWGLSQKLSRIIGPNRAREVSLSATPLTAEQAEKWGLVNHLVEESELLKKARAVAEAIIKNNQDLVLRYKSVINEGLKLDLGHALALEKARAHEYYNGMTKEQFKKMQEFIAGRSARRPAAKL